MEKNKKIIKLCYHADRILCRLSDIAASAFQAWLDHRAFALLIILTLLAAPLH